MAAVNAALIYFYLIAVWLKKIHLSLYVPVLIPIDVKMILKCLKEPSMELVVEGNWDFISSETC